MGLYYYKESLLKLLNLENVKYHINYITSVVNEKKFTNYIIKKLYSNFKGCNCKNDTCLINTETFIKYIKENLIIDDGKPECNYYYDINQTPIKIDNFNLII
jgi:hypothetical protein